MTYLKRIKQAIKENIQRLKSVKALYAFIGVLGFILLVAVLSGSYIIYREAPNSKADFPPPAQAEPSVESRAADTDRVRIAATVPEAVYSTSPGAVSNDGGYPQINANINPGLSTNTTQDTTPASIQKDARKRLPVLYYHAVDDNIAGLEELFVSPSEFEKQMAFLKDNHYTVITFDQIHQFKEIQNPVIITFDDGYENNYTQAYPILKKYGFNATIFLTTGFMDKPLFLKKHQVEEMKGLINFQSHAVTHPHLTDLNQEKMEFELSESKKILEALTGGEVNAFAYPFGDYNSKVLTMTKKYYKYAVLNEGDIYREGDNLLEIKRVYIPRALDLQGFKKKIGAR